MGAQQVELRRFSTAWRAVRRGFSMIELMVALSILVGVIYVVRMTFSGVSEQVGVSQATMDMTAHVRAIQQMLEQDLRGLDRKGFLVIRSRLLDNRPGITELELEQQPRFDQLSFLANGEFRYSGGADTVTPFMESNVANAAHIWVGHLVMEKRAGDKLHMPADQSRATPQDLLPTGVWDDEHGRHMQENVMVLGRHVTALFPGPLDEYGRVTTANEPIVAYPSLEGVSPLTMAGQVERMPAHITSGRFGAVAQTPAQLMQQIAELRSLHGVFNPEAEVFTYRFRALESVYETEAAENPFVNGYYRTTPVVMRGVSSFKIEWTTSDKADDWYGAARRKLGESMEPAADGIYRNVEYPFSPVTRDDYTATFSYFNRSKWPRALRFTMHVVNERLKGGRDFVFVVDLPR